MRINYMLWIYLLGGVVSLLWSIQLSSSDTGQKIFLAIGGGFLAVFLKESAEYLLRRPDLKVKFRRIEWYDFLQLEAGVEITIENHGKYPVAIKKIGHVDSRDNAFYPIRIQNIQDYYDDEPKLQSTELEPDGFIIQPYDSKSFSLTAHEVRFHNLSERSTFAYKLFNTEAIQVSNSTFSEVATACTPMYARYREKKGQMIIRMLETTHGEPQHTDS